VGPQLCKAPTAFLERFFGCEHSHATYSFELIDATYEFELIEFTRLARTSSAKNPSMAPLQAKEEEFAMNRKTKADV
jgi:hypothetical protein